MADLSSYKIAGGALAIMFFVYSVTSFIDKSIVSGDPKSSTNSNYMIGLLYLIISVLLAYYTLL